MGRRLLASLFFAPLLVIAVLNSGCTHTPFNPETTEVKERDQELFQYYDYPHGNIEARKSKRSETANYLLYRVDFPQALKGEHENSDIRIDYYQAKRPGKRPVILISPIFGRYLIFSRYFARYFASHGFHCAVVHEGKKLITELEETGEVEPYFRNTIIKNRLVVDWLVQQNEVDEDSLGSLGISFGAVKNVITAGVEPRLKYHVFALAGGSLADIVCYSHGRDMEKWRERIREKEGMSLSQLHQKLSREIKSDPLILGQNVDAKKTLLFVARFDRVIPEKCSRQLWESLGKPEAYYLPVGHSTSFLTLPYSRVKALQFFEKCFAAK